MPLTLPIHSMEQDLSTLLLVCVDILFGYLLCCGRVAADLISDIGLHAFSDYSISSRLF